MKPLSLFVALGLGSLVPAAVVCAQSNGNAGNTPAASASDQWQSLKALGKQRSISLPAHAGTTATQQARGRAITAYLGDADQLHQFYTTFPTDPNAAEARRKEAYALVYAVQLGDTADRSRRDQVVNAVRRDPALPEAEREQVAALADNVDAAAKNVASRAERLLAFEQVARGLQMEFPDVTAPVESLVQLAKASGDDRAAIIAKDVLGMSTPDTLKTQAQIVINRLGLKGEKIADVAGNALGSNNPIRQALGHPVAIYSWSSAVPASLALGKRIAAVAPAGTEVVGVCLDLGDLKAAKAIAGQAQPPGDQIYDPYGYTGHLAGRLRLTEPGWVYVVDAKGLIASVSAQHDLTAAFAALATP